MRFANSWGSWLILVACDVCLQMRFANGLSPCTLFLVALILKVGKCVLQLVENLAFIVICIACQLCKYVLQIELKRSAICGLILKVCKYVLQLVENLAFMSWVHLESICKCVLQLSCSLKAVCAFSGKSDEPTCYGRFNRSAVQPVFGAVWPHLEWTDFWLAVQENQNRCNSGLISVLTSGRTGLYGGRTAWSGRTGH